jgi:hypothetical protein
VKPVNGKKPPGELDSPPVARHGSFPWWTLGITFLIMLVGSVLSLVQGEELLFFLTLTGGFLYVLLLVADRIYRKNYGEALSVFLLGGLACLVAGAVGFSVLLVYCFRLW